MRMKVRNLAPLSGLSIRCCHELWCRSQARLGSWVAVAVAQASSGSSDSTSSLETSIYLMRSPEKSLKKKKKKKAFDFPMGEFFDSHWVARNYQFMHYFTKFNEMIFQPMTNAITLELKMETWKYEHTQSFRLALLSTQCILLASITYYSILWALILILSIFTHRRLNYISMQS